MKGRMQRGSQAMNACSLLPSLLQLLQLASRIVLKPWKVNPKTFGKKESTDASVPVLILPRHDADPPFQETGYDVSVRDKTHAEHAN